MDLRPGQRFLYVFDFGDNWNFWVQVVNIDPAVSEPGKPEIIEEKGESPKQYEYEDEDD